MLALLLATLALAHCDKTHPTPQGNITQHTTFKHAGQLSELGEVLTATRWKYYFTADGINWQLDLHEILSSQLTADLKHLISLDTAKYPHQNVTARILRRGDDVKIHRVCSGGEGGVVALLFLRVPPGANHYGEILFFNAAQDDVVQTIRAVQTQVLTFPCQTSYQWQYPAVQTQKGLMFLQYLFTDSPGLVNYSMSNEQVPFPAHGTYQRDEGLQIKASKAFSLTPDKSVFIIDDLFDEGTLASLRTHFLHTSSYIYNEQDDGEYSDNVITLTPQLTFQFTKSAMWGRIEQAVEQLTGQSGWYPYDVSNNLNEAWDHTRIHPDCFGREEYTFLLYLNPTYQPGDLGGTVWYTAESGEQILGSVMNKHGRAALFFCDIPHSARPPHAYITEPRLTFAVKMSRPRAAAVVRAMSESLANFLNDDALDQTAAEAREEERLIARLREYGGDVGRLEGEYEAELGRMMGVMRAEREQFMRELGKEGRQQVRDEL